jgi:hypothetical protein
MAGAHHPTLFAPAHESKTNFVERYHMSMSIAPTNPAPLLQQNSRLSDDDVISKAQNISTPSNPQGVRTVAGASGGHIRVPVRPSGPDSKT